MRRRVDMRLPSCALAPLPHWGGCTYVMHGRSGMTMGTRIPAVPGWSTSAFPPAMQTLFVPSAKRREVLGESDEGSAAFPVDPDGAATSKYVVAGYVFVK